MRICIYTDTINKIHREYNYDRERNDLEDSIYLGGRYEDNLSYIKAKKIIVYKWFKEYVLESYLSYINEDLSAQDAFERWLDEYTADETTELYRYLEEHNGLL